MHWKTLDLDPAHATEREVKRAYARRLKTCRPDQDPEGFKALHDAYQAALGEIEWRSRSGAGQEAAANEGPESIPILSNGDSPAATSVSVYDDALSPAAAAVLDVLERLERALIENQPGVGPLVREAEKALFQNPEEAGRWGNFVANLIARHGRRADLRFHPEVLIVELEHHCLAATFAIIDRLDQTGNSGGVESLAIRLLDRQDRIRTAAGGIAAARLACVAAFWSKDCVAPLADFAYANLARGERDFYMGHIDRHQAIGSLLQTVPDRHSNFWRQRLIDNSGREGWETETARSALRWLYSSAGGGNPAAEVLRGLVPENAAETLLGIGSPGSAPVGGAAAESGTSPSISETSGGGQTFSWESKRTAQPRQIPDWEVRAPRGSGRASQGRPSIDFGFLRFFIIPVVLVFGKLATTSSSSGSHDPPPRRFDQYVPVGRENLITEEQLQAERRMIQDWQRDHPPIIDSKPPVKQLPRSLEENPMYQQFKAGSGAAE